MCDNIDGLITIEEARSRAIACVAPIEGHEEIPLGHAIGRILARSVDASLPLPPFDQSAMDGYALAAAEGLPAGSALTVMGRVAAGDRAQALSQRGARRILTGAMVPQGTDAVVMQENVTHVDGRIILTRMARSGDNIRRRGEDVQAGETLLAEGTRIDARHVALLAAQGHDTVCVRRLVRVAVLSTGNELRSSGKPLAEGLLFDSNRPMVVALARQAGTAVVDGGIVPDDPQLIAGAFRNLAARCDLIVSTGGVSVGDEDHSLAALRMVDGTGEALKIALKPGKPAAIGKVGRAAYLGLPGNPVAALVSWLLLGGAVLAALENRPAQPLSGMRIPLAHTFERRPGRTEFVPARLVQSSQGVAAEILGRGGSARLKPLAAADGLVRIDALHAPVRDGELVMFHPFRDGFSL